MLLAAPQSWFFAARRRAARLFSLFIKRWEIAQLQLLCLAFSHMGGHYYKGPIFNGGKVA
jgi:hypothetical protein